jgi:hypothetical protein
MAQDFAKAFYNSKAWKDCRDGYIKSVFGLCERCPKPGYIVHHIIELTPENINDPDITLNWDNLEYLCLECHNSAHGDSGVVREGLIFDECGQLIERCPPRVYPKKAKTGDRAPPFK